jgi:hypothetical protein
VLCLPTSSYPETWVEHQHHVVLISFDASHAGNRQGPGRLQPTVFSLSLNHPYGMTLGVRRASVLTKRRCKLLVQAPAKLVASNTPGVHCSSCRATLFPPRQRDMLPISRCKQTLQLQPFNLLNSSFLGLCGHNTLVERCGDEVE